MKRLILPTALVLATAACPGPPGPAVECGDQTCSDGQWCDEVNRLCVTNLLPEIVIESPSADALITGNAVEVSGTITDDEEKIETAELSIDDGATWVALELGAEGGRFAKSLDVPALDSAALNIKVRAKDHRGAVAEKPVQVTVDNQGPACAFITPRVGDTIGSQHQSGLLVEVDARDGSGSLDGLQLQVDDEAPIEPKSFTGNLAQFGWVPPSASNGVTHNFVFTAKDSRGHGCQVAVEVLVDVVPPAVAITEPATDGTELWTLADPAKVLIKGTVDDGTGLPLPEVTVDFDDDQGPRVATVNPDGTWQLEIQLPEEDYKVHAIEARATDRGQNAVTAIRTAAVDRLAPRVTVTAPAANSKLKIADLGSNGTVNLSWTVTEASGVSAPVIQVSPDHGYSVTGNGTVAISTDPADNPTSYTVILKLKDDAGNEETATTTYQVDRVAPTVSFDRANNTRQNPSSLTATFSEAVTATGSTVVALTPTATPSVSGSVYSFASLSGDTVYAATVAQDSVRDAFGNPNPAATVQFHTAPVLPSTLVASGISAFEASSDPDGVVSIVARKVTGQVVGGWIDPVTGIASWPVTSSSPSIAKYSVTSWRTLSGLSANRVRGWSIGTEGTLPITGDPFNTAQLDWFSGATQMTPLAHNDSELIGVSVGPGCADPAGLPAMGVLKTNAYERGAVNETTSITPHALLQSGPDYFTAFEIGQDIVSQTRTCDCVGIIGQPRCTWGNRTVLYDGLTTPVHTNHRFSGARPPTFRFGIQQNVSGGMIFAFDRDDGSRHEFCEPACAATGGPVSGCAVPPSVRTPRTNQPFYAPRWQGQKVLVATRTGNTLELRERDLATSAGCTSEGTILASMTVGASVTAWKPAMFSTKPGVLYLDGSDLKVWIP